MADRTFRANRRQLLTGLGATVLGPVIPSLTAAQGRASPGHTSLVLRAKPGAIALRRGEADTPVWTIQGGAIPSRFKRGEELEITLHNELPAPMALFWRGIDGIPTAEPLTARAPLSPGGKETFVIPMRRAGTFIADFRLVGDGQTHPSQALAWIVHENESVGVDRDEVFLFEDWRIKPDGTAIAPGIDPKDTKPLYTINGQTTLEVSVRSNERLRLRFVNGFQRNVIALKIENHEVRVVALDGQPAEPFLTRNGTLVLAPGTRIDAILDATAPIGSSSSMLLHDGVEARPIARLITSTEPPIRRDPLPAAPPLPSNGLPAQIELKNALRFDLTLGDVQTEWVAPISFASSTSPAFRAKAGRTVVLTLTNRAEATTVFHLHGHHFRLLDRLDDGWKPFWLDTLAIESGQTQRVAFLAEYTGRWLIEVTPTAWTAPRLVRWYSVE